MAFSSLFDDFFQRLLHASISSRLVAITSQPCLSLAVQKERPFGRSSRQSQ